MNSKAGAIRAGKAFIELSTDNTRFLRGLKMAEACLKRFGQSLENIGRAMMKAGSLITAPLAISTKIFTGFDDQMKTVQAVTSATGKEFDNLTQKAKYLGRMTSFTAAQVASGMVQLGRQGFSTDQIDKGINSVLLLARATGTDLFEAAMIAGNTLRAFGLDVTEFQRIVDVMTATANNSAQGLNELGESMKYAAPIAAEFGMSLEATSHALGILANVGIKGSMSGTSLRAMMTRLADTAIQKRMRAIGVQIADNNGNFREFAKIMGDLGRATENMGNVERLAIFNEVFGRRSISAGAKLTTAAFDRLEKAIANAEGTAARTSNTMDSGIGGSLRMLWSALEGIAIAAGSALSKPIMTVAKWFKKAANSVADWIDKNESLVVVIAGLGSGLLAVGGFLTIASAGFKLLAFQMGAVNTVCKLFGGTMKLLGAVSMSLTSPIGIATAAVIGIGAAWVLTSKKSETAILSLGQKVLDFKDRTKRSWVEIADALAKGNLALAGKILWLQIKMEWIRGINALKKMWLDFKTSFLNVWHDISNAFLMTSTNMWEKFDLAVNASAAFMQKSFTSAVANIKSEFTALKVIGYQMKWQDKENRVVRPREDKEIEAKKAENIERGKTDPNFDVDAANRSVDREYLRKRNKRHQEYVAGSGEILDRALAIDAEKKKKLAAIKAKYKSQRQDITTRFDAMRKVIATKSIGERAKLEKERQEKLANNQKKLDAALAEWKTTVDGSKKAREDAAKPQKETTAITRESVRQEYEDLGKRNKDMMSRRKAVLNGEGGSKGTLEDWEVKMKRYGSDPSVEKSEVSRFGELSSLQRELDARLSGPELSSSPEQKERIKTIRSEMNALRKVQADYERKKAASLLGEMAANRAKQKKLLSQYRGLGKTPGDVLKAASGGRSALGLTWDEANATAAGSFSAHALGGLDAGGIAKAMADAAMRTADNTDKIVEMMDDGTGSPKFT